jgi:hypothetical protein
MTRRSIAFGTAVIIVCGLVIWLRPPTSRRIQQHGLWKRLELSAERNTCRNRMCEKDGSSKLGHRDFQIRTMASELGHRPCIIILFASIRRSR